MILNSSITQAATDNSIIVDQAFSLSQTVLQSTGASALKVSVVFLSTLELVNG